MTAPISMALAGHPVGHSLSPRLHQAALDSLGLQGTYQLLDVPHEHLAETLERVRQGELRGLNITVPHKEAVLPLLDELSPEAEALGAVNTVVADDDLLVGHNTDLGGLVSALRALDPKQPWEGGVICVLGAGGAARAAVFSAPLVGGSSVNLWNRTGARAEVLGACAPCTVKVFGAPEEAVAGAALILQATSMGMGQSPGTPDWIATHQEARRILEAAAPGAWLMDLVYAEHRTPWVAAARDAGLRAVDGKLMLAHQAAGAFALFTGRQVPVDVLLGAISPG